MLEQTMMTPIEKLEPSESLCVTLVVQIIGLVRIAKFEVST